MKVFDAKRRGGIIIYPEGREVFHDKVIPSKKTMPPHTVLVRVTQSPSFEGMESLVYAAGSLYRPHIIIDTNGELHQYVFLAHEGIGMAAEGFVIVDVVNPGLFEECRDGIIRSRLTQDAYDSDLDGTLYDFDNGKNSTSTMYTLINKKQVSSLLAFRLAMQRWKEAPFPFRPYPDDGVSEKCVGFDRNPYLSESKLKATADGFLTDLASLTARPSRSSSSPSPQSS